MIIFLDLCLLIIMYKIMAIKKIKNEYLSKKLANVSQLSCNIKPAITNMVFQIKLPIQVSSKNKRISILDNPAGIDIKLRIIGINLPKNIDL